MKLYMANADLEKRNNEDENKQMNQIDKPQNKKGYCWGKDSKEYHEIKVKVILI